MFRPKSKAEAKRLLEEVEATKLILEARTKDVHAIVIPARNYDGRPRIDIGIQGLTPKARKTSDPIVNLSNWISRRHEIKHKKNRVVGYAYPEGTDDFAATVITKAKELIEKFLGVNKAQTTQPTELRHYTC